MLDAAPDKIQALIDAARAEERAKMAVEAVLAEINRRLTTIESTLSRISMCQDRMRQGVDGNYTNINTVLQFLAAVWHGDKTQLSEIQQRLAEQAFVMRDREEGGDISVEAHGDVRLSADRVGRDKRDGEE